MKSCWVFLLWFQVFCRYWYWPWSTWLILNQKHYFAVDTSRWYSGADQLSRGQTVSFWCNQIYCQQSTILADNSVSFLLFLSMLVIIWWNWRWLLIHHVFVMFLRTKEIDARLGFLQRTFHLTGDEVRSVASTFPTLVSSRHWNVFVVSEVCSMTSCLLLLGLSTIHTKVNIF